MTDLTLYRHLAATPELVWLALTEPAALVALGLTPAAPGTELALGHAGFGTDEDRDSHVQGWQDCLDRLPGRLARPRV